MQLANTPEGIGLVFLETVPVDQVIAIIIDETSCEEVLVFNQFEA